MRPVSRRAFLATATGTAVAAKSPAIAALRRPPPAPLLLDDASRLNAVPIARHAVVRSADGLLIAELRAVLKEAAEQGRCVAIGGARHSMGGQSLPREDVAASLLSAVCVADPGARVYRVGAGMRCRDDQVLELGGSFYLPYRLHARPDQVRTAYPRVDEVIARKRHYDPQLRLRNLMWDKYFA